MDDYGAKASRDLIVTRGDGFRKEKNKKKRGSYKGGEITVSRRPVLYQLDSWSLIFDVRRWVLTASSLMTDCEMEWLRGDAVVACVEMY